RFEPCSQHSSVYRDVLKQPRMADVIETSLNVSLKNPLCTVPSRQRDEALVDLAYFSRFESRKSSYRLGLRRPDRAPFGKEPAWPCPSWSESQAVVSFRSSSGCRPSSGVEVCNLSWRAFERLSTSPLALARFPRQRPASSFLRLTSPAGPQQ